MKLLRPALLAALLPLFAFVPPARAEGPALPIRRAIEMAEESLRSKGVEGSTYIKSISLERSTVLSRRAVWVITWSDSIPASKPGSKESGLEINMQGDIVHLLGGGHGNRYGNTPH